MKAPQPKKTSGKPFTPRGEGGPYPHKEKLNAALAIEPKRKFGGKRTLVR